MTPAVLPVRIFSGRVSLGGALLAFLPLLAPGCGLKAAPSPAFSDPVLFGPGDRFTHEVTARQQTPPGAAPAAQSTPAPQSPEGERAR